MRVAHTLSQGDGVALDDGHAVVQGRVVIAIVGDGIAYLLVPRVITIKIGEEVGHHLVGVLRFFSHGLFLLGGKRRHCDGSHEDDSQ